MERLAPGAFAGVPLGRLAFRRATRLEMTLIPAGLRADRLPRAGLGRAAALRARDAELTRLDFFLRVASSGVLFLARRRSRFQTFRLAAACLRARRASRLASLSRLRARFNSSFAMRTRCLATSACKRARSTGFAPAASAGWLESGDISLPVFFIGGLRAYDRVSVTQAFGACHPSSGGALARIIYPQNVCITMWTGRSAGCKGQAPARACINLNEI